MSVVRRQACRRFRDRVAIATATLGLVATGLFVAPRVLESGSEADDPVMLTSSALTADLNKVAAGGEHSCGIKARRLYCWGRNTWGQIGNGGRGYAVAEPARVGAKGWRTVAVGGATSCGIRGDKRTLKCWGLNSRGQLGDGTTTWSSRPKHLARKRHGWRMVDTGWYHTCAVRKRSHRLWCWGDNSHGQLGQGDRKTRHKPTRLPGRWRKVAVEGWTTCAIKVDRRIYCWGRNILGQVGDGTLKDRERPRQIGEFRWRRVDVSWTHTCAVRMDRSTWCWGNNDRGQVGDGTTHRRLRPARVARGLVARDVSTTELGSCLTTRRTNQLWCWGDDRYGQVGGKWAKYRRPQRLTGRYHSVSSGWLHSCAVRPGGGVDCWGTDERAQVRAATHRRVRRAAYTEETPPQIENVSYSAAAAKDPLRFRLATYNVLGEIHTGAYRHMDHFAPSRVRAEWTVQAFRTHDLDIVGIQEPTQGQVAAMLKAGNGRFDAYPRPSDNKSNETTIMWKTHRFKAVRKRAIWTQFIGREYPRPYIKFKDRRTGRKFWVMNIHNAPWDYQKKRDKAVREQLAKIQELEATGLPVYYVGDFNEWRNIFCKVMRKTGLNTPLGGRLTKDGKCKAPRARMRVDWIFGSKSSDWSNHRVVKYPVLRLTTDHWVKWVDVTVR